MINPALGSLIDKVRQLATPICLPDGESQSQRGLTPKQIAVLVGALTNTGLVKSSLSDGALVLAGREKYDSCGNPFIIVSQDSPEGMIYSYTVTDNEHKLLSVTWLDRLDVIDQYVQILSRFLPPPVRSSTGEGEETLI